MRKYIVLPVFILFAAVLAAPILRVYAVDTVQHEIEKSTTPSGSIVPADLGIKNIGTLPTSPFYFFKEWRRGIERFFTFNAVKKAELELRITNEKAAEAFTVSETKPDDTEALAKAIGNYTDATERLQARLAKVKETSENPNVAKLLERLNGQTLKHALLFNQLAQRWDTDPYVEDANVVNPRAARDNHLQGAVDILQKKIQETVASATEKEKNIEQKAKEQITRAEAAIHELESELAEFAINEPGVLNEKTGPIRLDPTPARISTNVTIEKQTPKRDFGDRMKEGLDAVEGILADAKARLALATAAFADGKFGEAFGQGRAAEVTVWKGLKLFTDKNGDGTMGKDEMEKLLRPGTDADTPRIEDETESMAPPMPNIPLPKTAGDKPTQSNFSNLIDSSLNLIDDGIERDDGIKSTSTDTATSTGLNATEFQSETVSPTVIIPSSLGR